MFHPFSGVTSLAYSLKVTSAADAGRFSAAVVASARYAAASVFLSGAKLYSPRSSIADLNRNRAGVF
jgi:hypothetical protein